MKRNLLVLPLIATVALTACAGSQKKDEESATGEAGAPGCGDYVLVVESPVVASGDYQKDRIQRAVMQGLEAGDCRALTTRPAAAGDATVLVMSLRAISTGDDSGRVSAAITDATTGDVRSRFQERVQGDGVDGATTLGRKVAGHLTGSGEATDGAQ